MSYQLICKICREPFEHQVPHAVTCSDKCRLKNAAALALARYHKDLARARKMQVQQKRLRFAARWELILATHGDKCSRCGNKYPPVVYDLHHPNGKSGRHETPAMIVGNGSEKAFLAMLKVVVIMCANCHRLHHSETGNWAPARNNSLNVIPALN